MAINPSTRWKNEHKLILAGSGGGKSQLAAQLPDVPYRGVRSVFWDPEPDHRANHYSTRKEFLAALRAALQWCDGKPESRGFRLAYTVQPDMPKEDWPEEHEWLCKVVWTVLNGDYRFYFYDEEMSSSCTSAGKAGPYHSLLMERGRKYGLVYIGTTQRSQKIPKDCFDLCDIQYVGKHKRGRAAEFTAKACDIPIELVPTEDLHFTLITPDSEEPQQIVIEYKEIDTTG